MKSGERAGQYLIDLLLCILETVDEGLAGDDVGCRNGNALLLSSNFHVLQDGEDQTHLINKDF